MKTKKDTKTQKAPGLINSPSIAGSLRRLRSLAIGLAVVGSLGYPRVTMAQSAPSASKTHFSHLNFTCPPFWKTSTNAGWMMLVPDDLLTGQTAFIGISPGGETTKDLAAEFDEFVKASQNGMSTVQTQPAKTTTDSQGLPTMAQTVVLQDAAGTKLMRFYIAKKNGTRFESMTFSASPDAVTKYFPAFKDFYSKLSYDGAPGQGSTQGTPGPPNAPQQNLQAIQPAAGATGPVLPTGSSPIMLMDSGAVTKNAKGELVVSPEKTAGIKLSKHDKQMYSVAMAVGHDGTIHVAYVEATVPNLENAVYYRSSSDGGKSWTDAKNLSDPMAGYEVGYCQIAVDASDRVYVIWRVAGQPNLPTDAGSHSGNLSSNIVYRVLSGGQWNGTPLNVNPPATQLTYDKGAASWYAGSDPTGKVHVAYVENTDIFHANLMFNAGSSYPQHEPRMLNGSIAQVDLDGTSHTAPHEIFMAQVEIATGGIKVCEGFDTLEGYFDASGVAHMCSYAYKWGEPDGTNRIVLIEGGVEKPGIVLPGQSFAMWTPPATLLLDAQGRNHIIAFFRAGEKHGVRDYLMGSDFEPTLIREANPALNGMLGFEALQGPKGQMIVLMQMNDSGAHPGGELYISTSSGNGWTKPVNVSNNEGRTKSTYTATAPRANVATTTRFLPGMATANFDKQGHLILVDERDEYAVFGNSAYGVSFAGGDVTTPRLYFVRF